MDTNTIFHLISIGVVLMVTLCIGAILWGAMANVIIKRWESRDVVPDYVDSDFCASCGIFFDDTIHFHRVKVECDNQNVDDEGGNSKMCYVCCGCYEIHKSKYVAP